MGFLCGPSVPDLDDLDLRKTRRSRIGSGLGRWQRKSGMVISLNAQINQQKNNLSKNDTYLVFCSPHPRTSKTDKEASLCVTRLRAKVKTGTRSEAFLAHQTNTMLTCLSFTSEINASEGLFGILGLPHNPPNYSHY